MSRRTLGLLLAVLCVPACDAPRFKGPMIQALPHGFIREPEARQDHEIFPSRDPLTSDAYVVFSGDFSGFYIRKYAGGLTRQDVEDARNAAAAAEADGGVSYGPIEEVRVDGNLGWGWLEETRDPRGLLHVEFRTVIPYADSVTYTVEFSSSDPNWKAEPDSMRILTTSFAIGKIEWNFPLIGLITVVTFLVLSFIWNKISVKNPSTSYRLSSIPVPEPHKGSDKTSAPGGDQSSEPSPPAED